MTEVTLENIGYIAVLVSTPHATHSYLQCRHVLNGKGSWSTEDGGFHANVFYNNILDLFDGKQWAEDTLR